MLRDFIWWLACWIWNDAAPAVVGFAAMIYLMVLTFPIFRDTWLGIGVISAIIFCVPVLLGLAVSYLQSLFLKLIGKPKLFTNN
jgi:hypothetical protein